MSEPKVSVVVVSFNTREKLRRCLNCIEPEHETIVVDNASDDGSPEMVESDFPRVHLVRNPTNRGFGAANNVGASLATGSLILYLNSDAYAEPGAIARLASNMAGDVVAAGGRLLNPDGSLQESVAGPLTLWSVFLEQSLLDRLVRRSSLGYWRTQAAFSRWEEEKMPVVVDQVMGACLMVRKDSPGFDERYFLYCEDTDLCRRLSDQGKIVYDPSACFSHDLGSSSARDPAVGIARYNRGKELYFRIHHGFVAQLACRALDRWGALLRLMLWVARFNRRQAALFARVLSSPL